MDKLTLNIINDDEYPIPSKEYLLKCFELVTSKHNIDQAEVNINIVSNSEIKNISSLGCSTVGTEDEKGTGLGLSICKEFIENHKGELKIESQVGVGSCFSFDLPSV